MALKKLVDPETIRINQELLTHWGGENVETGFRPYLLISGDGVGNIKLSQRNDVTDGQALEMLELLCRKIKDKIKIHGN